MSDGLRKANDYNPKKQRNFGFSKLDISPASKRDFGDLDLLHCKTTAASLTPKTRFNKAHVDRRTSFSKYLWQGINSLLAVSSLLAVLFVTVNLKQSVENTDLVSPRNLASKGEMDSFGNLQSNVFGMFVLNQSLLAEHGRLVWQTKSNVNFTRGVEADDKEPCVQVFMHGLYKVESQITFKFGKVIGVFSGAHAISTKRAPLYNEDILVKSPIQTSPKLFVGNGSIVRQLHTSYLSVLTHLNPHDMICVQTNPNKAVYVSPIDNMLDVIRILSI